MLQFITHTNDRFDETAGAAAALDGDCRWVQLRMKHASDDEIIAKGKTIAHLCMLHGATFIIDDRVDLVATLGADGVHLGKNDMPVAEARRMLGSSLIIGATANTFDDIVRAAADGADYIGLGPYRFTTTKERLSPTLGLDGYRDIMARCRREGIKLPVVAIGGITADDIPALMGTGIAGVAVSGAIMNAEDPVAETKKIITMTKP